MIGNPGNDRTDPLFGDEVMTEERTSSGVILLSLRTGKRLLLKANNPHSVRQIDYEVLETICQLSDFLLKLVGETTLQSRKWLVYEYTHVGCLSDVIRNMASGSTRMWEERVVLEYMRMMAQAVDTLHEHNLIHRSVNTANFILMDNQVIKLSCLEKIVEIREENALATMRIREKKWLGSCFISMITFIEFDRLYQLAPEEQVRLCRTEAKFISGNVQQIAENLVLHGEFQSRFKTFSSPKDSIATPSPMDTREIASDPESFLPRLSTEGSSYTSESSKTHSNSKSRGPCLICANPSDFQPPCNHLYCASCFVNYIKKLLLKDSLSEAELVCKMCHKPLEKHKVFSMLENLPLLLNALDAKLIRNQIVKCSNCGLGEVIDEENAVLCRCRHCNRTFCSRCRAKPHGFGACPVLARK